MIYLTHFQLALSMYRYAFSDIPACLKLESALLHKVEAFMYYISQRIIYAIS